jgi:succinate dehydrogenase/fumarate reductase flavoprotein subunit
MAPQQAATGFIDHVDLLVIGSGAGGLSCAVTAAHLGLKVLVVEKETLVGGTTAWSGGWMWITRNPLAVAAGIVEDIETPLSYLRHELGPHFDEPRLRAFLEAVPRMVDFFRTKTALQFIDGNGIPDFHGRSPDAATGGRSVCAAPFDGRRLGKIGSKLKPPLWETTLWGMGIAAGAELRHFLNATRSPASLWHAASLLLRYGRDCLLYGRGMRLVNGNALAAGLLASAIEAGVQVRTESSAQSLIKDQGRVIGARIATRGGALEVRARCGVVLACGGFPHDATRKKALLPHAPTGAEHWSAASWGNTGDGLRLGEAAGGVVGSVVGRDFAQGAALAPVSLVPQKDGSFAHFAHLIERGKPGLIAVTPSGQRFVNEADSYYDFVCGLLKATPADHPVQAWLIADHTFIRRYGLGAVKPAPMPLRPWLRNGYLVRANSVTKLAESCQLDAQALQATIEKYNLMAQSGSDTDFAKGETPYNRMQGDALADLANPCMAPIQQGPFYAVNVVVGSLGTFAGLKVNAEAQVLNSAVEPIAGLYAAGNDMASVMGGHYPSGGITLGPAMTFGFLAAHHAAGRF